jgi:Tat protein translocase TatB subunit
MLNVGPLELLVVLAVALIVVGPERLPELARSVGRAVRQLRQIQDEVRDMVASGVDDDVRQAATDFKKATGDIARAAGTATAPRKVGRSMREEVRKTVRPTPARRPRTDGPSLPDADAPPPDTPSTAPGEAPVDAPGGLSPGGEPEDAGAVDADAGAVDAEPTDAELADAGIADAPEPTAMPEPGDAPADDATPATGAVSETTPDEQDGDRT